MPSLLTVTAPPVVVPEPLPPKAKIPPAFEPLPPPPPIDCASIAIELAPKVVIGPHWLH